MIHDSSLPFSNYSVERVPRAAARSPPFKRKCRLSPMYVCLVRRETTLTETLVTCQFIEVRPFESPPQLFCHPSCMATRKLSLVTWNVWFDAFESFRRFSHIFHLMEKHQPDVILFQEVTPYFLQLLQKQSWIDTYDCSDDFSCTTVDPYGVLSLCKKSLYCKFQFIPLPSNMERLLLICRTSSLDLNLVIVNVHLESLANSVLREKQLQVCSETFADDLNWILCGDYNFCSYKNFAGNGPLENASLQRQLPGYCDMWKILRPNDKGNTVSTFLT